MYGGQENAMREFLLGVALACGLAACDSRAEQLPPAADDRDPSVARRWNEALLASISRDLARPTVHARNLWHVSAAMYDGWAAYDDQSSTWLLGRKQNGYPCEFSDYDLPADKHRAREQTISFAAYRIIRHRFRNSQRYDEIVALTDQLMQALGYDPALTSAQYQNGAPAALGNYIAECYIGYGLADGSNETDDYAPTRYEPVNPPLEIEEPGNPNLVDMDRWQQIKLPVSIDQSGNVVSSTPNFVGPEWGAVHPFSLTGDNKAACTRKGFEVPVFFDPGPPPGIHSPLSTEYKWTHSMVAIWGSHLDPTQGRGAELVDISPATLGNIQDYPTSFEEHRDFYDFLRGDTTANQGYSVNPATAEPYDEQRVPLGDYARVLAEYWADGPNSVTPPGHWFDIANHVADHPLLVKRIAGAGPVVGPLEWDIKLYFALGGAMHDAAITAWSIKGCYDYIRPVSAIRAMAERGQDDPTLPSYDPEGISLVPGYIELVEAGEPLAGADNEHVGKIKLYSWRGPSHITNPAVDAAGVGWVLAENWWPYQRPTFVTPPFAGYVSGHSTYSRTAAELMARFTGDAYFPGGKSEFHAPKNEYLVFEKGPSVDVVFEWAKYVDASDQCSLSRIWGGIHPPADDLSGRHIGMKLGPQALNHALDYIHGRI